MSSLEKRLNITLLRLDVTSMTDIATRHGCIRAPPDLPHPARQDIIEDHIRKITGLGSPDTII